MRAPRRAINRKKPGREPYDRVLIVCEGARTEPKYFSELVRRCRLSTANVEILGEGAAPLAIVGKAVRSQKEERRRGEKYDKVYCVFDRDEHARFDEASFLARKGKLELGRSWPCFEFWLLLHFRYTRRPYERSHGRSPAENCIGELRQFWPDYEKAKDGIFDECAETLETAKGRAARAAVDARQTGNPNPSTEVHELVAYLQDLKEPERR